MQHFLFNAIEVYAFSCTCIIILCYIFYANFQTTTRIRLTQYDNRNDNYTP